jgi:hypothetical protein
MKLEFDSPYPHPPRERSRKAPRSFPIAGLFESNGYYCWTLLLWVVVVVLTGGATACCDEELSSDVVVVVEGVSLAHPTSDVAVIPTIRNRIILDIWRGLVAGY